MYRALIKHSAQIFIAYLWVAKSLGFMVCRCQPKIK
jgi:hypothetical protein